MSSSRRYTSSGNRGSGRDKTRGVTDLRIRHDDESGTPAQHARIQEDSIVDACCDHAHAVARVHGAQEVMLEHLIHALARVPEAAEVLEEQGYDVDHIRRESAAVIASDIPVGKHDPKRALYASNDFNTVLHLAAANASRQGEAEISIWELLEAISGYDDALPSVRILNDGFGRKRDYPHSDAHRTRLRRRGTGGRSAGASPSQRYHAPTLSIRNDASSDELLQQGLAAIETALRRQSETEAHSDPRLEEKLAQLDARISALTAQRAEELTELKELVATLKERDDDRHTRAVHADLIALRETMDKRDNEMREMSAQIEQRVEAVKDDVGAIISDPQTGLRDEIIALSERIDGAGSSDISKLSTSMEQRLVNMENLISTRQSEILGLHSTLGEGVDEQGARLQGLEARLMDEHDQTQDEMRAIRGFLEKIAGTVDHYSKEIDRLRLDHIGDMSVLSNQFVELSGQMERVGARIARNRHSIGAGRGGGALRVSRPSRARERVRKSSGNRMRDGGRSEIKERVIALKTSDRSSSDAMVEKKLVIDAEETTQHVAQRFAKQVSDELHEIPDRGPRGSMDYGRGDLDEGYGSLSYRGQKVRRTRSSARRAQKGQTLGQRLVLRGRQLKDQYKIGQQKPVSPGGSTSKPGWGRRFWEDVKGLFRDEDRRWTDWRK